MIHNLSDEFCSPKIEGLISVCKSNSGMQGTELRNAHYRLGKILAESYSNYFNEECCVVSFMRSALPFSFGFADFLDCPITFYNSEDDFFQTKQVLFQNKKIIFIDAVINSGEGMLRTIRESKLPQNNVAIITNVLSEKSVDKFFEYEVFTTRISKNFFKGEKVQIQSGNIGPDTGDRLFRTL
ncbi:MAG: uracil phosphoribosyltransferase [Treponema sp.]|nr:uracil phosphoribosyltransferase [Treponema sp.]